MGKRTVIGIVGGIVVVVLLVALLFPAAQSIVGRRTEAPVAPNFASTVKVSPARVVLPPSVPGTAAIYLDLTNSGGNTVNLTRVSLEHAPGVLVSDTSRPKSEAVAMVPVDPGQTVSFAPHSRYTMAANYDANMVPGAKVQVTLTFGTSGSVSVPATVEPGTGRNGTAGPGQERQKASG